MISKEQYIDALIMEMGIMKHLAEKVTENQMSHKPTDMQRTTAELLHYLTYIFAAGTEGATTGDSDSYKKYINAPVATRENFAELIEKEKTAVLEFLTPMTEENLKEDVTMWGRTQSRALHLLQLLKIASAYKMQLFLYLKQSGTENIGTMNLWAGMDQPPKVS